MKYLYLIANVDLNENNGATKHFVDLYHSMKLVHKNIRIFVRKFPDEWAGMERQDFIGVPFFRSFRLGKWGTLIMILTFELALFIKLLFFHNKSLIKGFYLRQTNLNFACPLISYLFHIPLIVEANSLLLEDLKESGVNILRVPEKYIERFTFRNCAHCRVITENMKKYYVDMFDLDESKISVIPNGYNFAKKNHIIKKSRKRTIRTSEFSLLYVGFLHKREGVHILIEAISHISEQFKYKLNIIGGGLFQIELEKLVLKFNLSSKVNFLGSMHPDRLEEYYLNSDICFAPFIQERNEITGISPVKIFEYLAHRCPIICSELPGLEFINQFQCGLAIRPDDPILLAKSTEWLMENYSNHAEQYANNGFTYIKENHNWEDLSAQINHLCNQYFT